MSKCNLCKREGNASFYYEDELVWVVNSFKKDIPMVVWKRHQSNISAESKFYMRKIANKLFPNSDFKLQYVYDEHIHCYIEFFEGVI